MARGWESKSIESQIESAEARKAASRAAMGDPVEAERKRQRGSLLLQRTRILHDLEQARHARHKETLEAALKHLDQKLAEVGVVPLRFCLAGIENLEAVTGIINLAFRAAESFFIDRDRIDTETVREMATKGSFILAYDADCLAGCVYVAPAGERAYIGLLSVDPGRQRFGIGGALMDAAEEHCRKAGCRFADLKVVNIREELPEYYRRRAYVVTGTEPFPPDKNPKVPCHFLVMTKALDQAAGAST